MVIHMKATTLTQNSIFHAGINDPKRIKVTVRGISKPELKACLMMLRSVFNCSSIHISKREGV